MRHCCLVLLSFLLVKMPTEITAALIVAIPSFLTGLIAVVIAFRKAPAEIKKTDADSRKANAETDNLHAQVADRWAEHVIELQNQITKLDLDISQVRRENESYRLKLIERDRIIAKRDQAIYDLKDWAERLLHQLQKHAPDVKPEAFISRELHYGNEANMSGAG